MAYHFNPHMSREELQWWDTRLPTWPNYEHHEWTPSSRRQKQGRDALLIYMGGKCVEVETKMINTKPGAVPIEVWHSKQDSPDSAGWPGWVAELACDFIVFGFRQTGVAAAVYFPFLKRAHEQHWGKRKWSRNRKKTDGRYWTWNVWVKQDEIAQKCGFWQLNDPEWGAT